MMDEAGVVVYLPGESYQNTVQNKDQWGLDQV